MEFHYRKETFELTETDILMDNGKCVQLVTQKAGVGWERHNPTIPMIVWDDLVRDDHIKLIDSRVLSGVLCKYYRFKG